MKIDLKKFLKWINSRFGIQSKLSIIFIAFSTIPLISFGVYAIQTQIDSMKSQSLHNIKIDLLELEHRTSAFFSQIESEMHFLSKTSEMARFLEDINISNIKDKNRGDKAKGEILKLIGNKDYYTKFNVLNSKGLEVFAVMFNNGKPFFLQSQYLSPRPFWFYLFAVQQIQQGEQLILPSEIKLPEKQEIVPTISFIKPLFNKQKELTSIFLVHIDFQRFINLFDRPKRTKGGNILIVNNEGYYIFESNVKNLSSLLAYRDDKNLLKDYPEEITKPLLNGGRGTLTADPKRIIEYASIIPENIRPVGHYIIFIDVETSILFSKIYKFRGFFMLVVIVVGILSVIIGVVTSRFYLKPIKKLIAGAKHIKEGNLDFKFSSDSRDEIQILTESFNLLIKKSRKAIQESEERFYQIFKQSDNAIFLFDSKNHKIIDTNPEALNLFGYKENDIIEKNISIFFEASSFPNFKKLIFFPRKNSAFYLDQVDCLKKNSTVFKAAVKGKIIKHKNVFVVYCEFKDLSEENKLKEEKRLVQEKLIQSDKLISLGILASGVAHEINNPNNSIMLNIAALSEIWSQLEPIVEEYSEKNKDFSIKGVEYSEIKEKIPKLFFGLKMSSRRIKSISKDLKDFSRKEPLDLKTEVDVNKVVKISISLVQNLISKSTKHFSVNYCKNLPKINGNFQKLEQVMINLLQNACDSLTDTGKKIRLTTAFDRETNLIEIKVGDEGCGIDKENISLITDPFFTTKRNMGGTGLGLSIALSILRDHDGSLEFSSEAGKGTIVSVRLPALGKKQENKIDPIS